MPSRRRDAIHAAHAAALALGLATSGAAAQPAPAQDGAASKPEVVVPPRPVTLHADYPDGATGDAAVVLVITVNADGSVRSARPAEGAPDEDTGPAVAWGATPREG